MTGLLHGCDRKLCRLLGVDAGWQRVGNQKAGKRNTRQQSLSLCVQSFALHKPLHKHASVCTCVTALCVCTNRNTAVLGVRVSTLSSQANSHYDMAERLLKRHAMCMLQVQLQHGSSAVILIDVLPLDSLLPQVQHQQFITPI